MPKPLYIATRGSPLALAQANLVLAQCRAALPDQSFEIQIVKTTGDKIQTASLASAGLPKGLFTKELEVAVLNREADLAVHSLKDLPTELPPGLKLGAVLERADARDVLIYRHVEFIACWPDSSAAVNQRRRGFKPELSINALPYAATVATSSTRRRAQLLDRRLDLNVVPIRGNVGTRLKKLADQPQIDAIVLAAAGLERLGIELQPGAHLFGADVPPGLAGTRLTLSEMLPCVGQAAIGIEIRDNDPLLEGICAKVNHAPTQCCVVAERAFLSAMGGGCQLAVAAHAEISGSDLRIRGVSFLKGAAQRSEATGNSSTPQFVGEQLARELQK
jgi:porphobilinogen deaminase